MSTIQENLQTIADSTAAIKQAIIDKGGEITGDITTWASAISGISGGGSAEEEIVFTGNIVYSMSNINLSGFLSSKPDLSPIYVVLLYLGTGAVASKTFISDISNRLSLTIDTGEPLMGTERPGICLMHPRSGKVFPVTLNVTINSGGSTN